MNEDIFLGDLGINPNQHINQNIPLDNNQLLQNDDFNRNAKILRNGFIAPIIILPTLEVIITLITFNYFNDSKNESEHFGAIVAYSISFPISSSISVIIILINLLCLNFTNNKIVFLILFFILKSVCTLIIIIVFHEYTYSIIFIIIVFITFTLYSFVYEIKLKNLQNEY